MTRFQFGLSNAISLKLRAAFFSITLGLILAASLPTNGGGQSESGAPSPNSATEDDPVDLTSIDSPPADSISCPRYKIYYIDPATQFFTAPVPLERHAEFVFCSDHAALDDLRVRLKNMKPIRSRPDLDSARIKAVPRGKPDDALVFCANGEITFRGKQYRINRRIYEPALVSMQAEGDKRRATEEQNAEDEHTSRSRNPAKAR